MFDFHLGNGLVVSSSAVQSPLVVLGRPGQGKTVFLLQYALELIKNAQTGVLYDPYGDLGNSIYDKATSDEAKKHVRFLTQAEFLAEDPGLGVGIFTVVAGDTITDGSAVTRPQAQQVIRKSFEFLTEADWLIVDQACDSADADLFARYIRKSGGPKVVVSDQGLIDLSEAQRETLFATAVQWAVYKTQNIDGVWVEKYLGKPTAKKIAAMEQYHFYWIGSATPLYTTGVFPVQSI